MNINKKYRILTFEYGDIIGVYAGYILFVLYGLRTGCMRSGDGDNRLLYIGMFSSEYFRINTSLSSISKKFS